MVALKIRWRGDGGGGGGGGSYSCLLPPTCTISDVCVWRDTTFALGDSAYEIKELVEHIKLVSINTRPRVFINLYCFAFVVRFEKFSMKWKFIAEMVNEIVIWIAD